MRGVDLPAGFGASLPKGFRKELQAGVVLEAGFAAVAMVHDMVDRARILDAQRAGHGGVLPTRRFSVNSED